MSSTLKWEPYLNSERADVGALEFFVCATQGGADLYCDCMSFDQGYGCVSYASAEAAKSAAEEIARHTFDELSALFAPVLRWDNNEHSEAELGAWTLAASMIGWSIYVDSPLTGRELIACASTERGERDVNRRAAETSLRGLGVSFRTEDGR